jgi:hypothetical protein
MSMEISQYSSELFIPGTYAECRMHQNALKFLLSQGQVMSCLTPLKLGLLSQIKALSITF